MTALRRRSATTTVTYDVTDSADREQPDTGVLKGGHPFRTFRPTEVTVTVDWTSGATLVEMRGPSSGAVPGWTRIELDHYNDAASSRWPTVRDAVGQACIDRDKRNI